MNSGRSATRENVSTRRLEAFTDGVFAIAATLLVLDLSVDGFGTITTSAQLWNAIVALQYNLLSFAISFLLLCVLWSVHTRQFEHVKRVDGLSVKLNSLRLFAVVVIPFTTSINSEYNGLWLGQILLPANFFIVIVLGSAQWFVLTSPRRRLTEGLAADAIRATRVGSVVASVVAGVVVMLSPIIGSWAFGVFFLNAPAASFFERIARRRVQAGRRPPA
jgi:uncharacterized membrane protein